MNESVDKIVDCLFSEGVVVIPTDTIYGIAALPTSQKAVERIYTLKQRPKSINLPIMVASKADIKAVGFEVNDCAEQLLESPLMPGSLTIIMGIRSDEAPEWLKNRDEAALRIPDDKQLLAVLRKTGPLLVTSANSHGLETSENLEAALSQLHGEPDLAIDGGTLHTVPSTIVNCRKDPPVIERHGVIPEVEVMKYIK